MSSIEQTVREITVEESRGSIVLWFGILGSPLAWAGHLITNYTLEEWFACSPSNTARGEVLGFTVTQASVALNSLMAVIAAAAGLSALVCWRRGRRLVDGDTVERTRWMGFVGVVEGAIFLPMILLGYAIPVLIRTCTTTA